MNADPEVSSGSITLEARARVWIVEDDSAFRSALAHAIDQSPSSRCGGAFATGEAVLEALRRGEPRPAVVLMDVSLPGIDGVACAGRFKVLVPAVHIVMLTLTDDASTMAAALRAGASGYLIKHVPVATILRTIEEAQRGTLLVPPRMRDHVVQLLLARGHRPERGSSPAALRKRFGLRGQEARVALLLAERRTNAEIADALCLSEHTVRHYAATVLRKLGVRRRMEVGERVRGLWSAALGLRG